MNPALEGSCLQRFMTANYIHLSAYMAFYFLLSAPFPPQIPVPSVGILLSVVQNLK